MRPIGTAFIEDMYNAPMLGAHKRRNAPTGFAPVRRDVLPL
jgi:hypothetical protein